MQRLNNEAMSSKKTGQFLDVKDEGSLQSSSNLTEKQSTNPLDAQFRSFKHLLKLLYDALVYTDSPTGQPAVPEMPSKKDWDRIFKEYEDLASSAPEQCGALIGSLVGATTVLLAKFFYAEYERLQEAEEKQNQHPEETKEGLPQPPIQLHKTICLYLLFQQELIYSREQIQLEFPEHFGIEERYDVLCELTAEFQKYQNTSLVSWVLAYPKDQEKQNQSNDSKDTNTHKQAVIKQTIAKLVEDGAELYSFGPGMPQSIELFMLQEFYEFPFMHALKFNKKSLAIFMLDLALPKNNADEVVTAAAVHCPEALKKIAEIAPHLIDSKSDIYLKAISNPKSLEILFQTRKPDPQIIDSIWKSAVECDSNESLKMVFAHLDKPNLQIRSELLKNSIAASLAHICPNPDILECLLKAGFNDLIESTHKIKIENVLMLAPGYDHSSIKVNKLVFWKSEVAKALGLKTNSKSNESKADKTSSDKSEEDGFDVNEFMALFGCRPKKQSADMFINVTPLMLAAIKFSIEHIKLLIQYGADPNKKCDRGFTALDYAERLLKQRLKHGKDDPDYIRMQKCFEEMQMLFAQQNEAVVELNNTNVRRNSR